MNYHGKLFRPVQTSPNGESNNETVFKFKQEGSIVTAEYSGGKVLRGQLLGLVDTHGNINLRYHHINEENQLMTGICLSRPEILSTGRIRLHEEWVWTSGDCTSGKSIIEEF